jgi:hypothetical protein
MGELSGVKDSGPQKKLLTPAFLASGTENNEWNQRCWGVKVDNNGKAIVDSGNN